MHSDGNSTLANLQPLHFTAASGGQFKTSLRLQGSYLTALKRVSKMPEASRPYLWGDLPAMIDWKAFARSDQLIVRQQRDEASALVGIICDLSASMQWPTRQDLPVAWQEQAIIQKSEIACRIALHLSHLHLRWGDQVSLWLLSEANAFPHLGLRLKSPADVLSMYANMASQQFSASSLAAYFQSESFSPAHYDRFYWLSDALSNDYGVSLFRPHKRDCMFHLLSSLEQDFSWTQDHVCYFEYPFPKKEFLGSQLKKSDTFTQAVQRWQKNWEERVHQHGGIYFFATEQTTIQHYLNFLGEVCHT